MTLEGQAADREPRRGQLGGRLLPLLRRDRPRLGARDPPSSSPLSCAMVLASRTASGAASCPGTTAAAAGLEACPALAAGNATVCVPSEVTPLSTLMLAPCVEHRRPASSTWSRAPARWARAHRGPARRRRRLHRLGRDRQEGRPRLHGPRCPRQPRDGRKDPSSSAPIQHQLDVAARGGAWAAFLNAGQVCTSSERFYVMDDVYDDYVNAFVDVAKGLVIGDPMRSDTDVGPMVSANQRSKVEASGPPQSRPGPRCWSGATQAATSGPLLRAVPVTGADAETALLSEETFGPVAPLVPVKDLDEAIELANSTLHGLGANIYTQDFKTILRCMREVKAGTVWFNDPLTDNDAAVRRLQAVGPGTGVGREGLEAFQEQARPHRVGDRRQAVVVPVRRVLGGRRAPRGLQRRAWLIRLSPYLDALVAHVARKTGRLPHSRPQGLRGRPGTRGRRSGTRRSSTTCRPVSSGSTSAPSRRRSASAAARGGRLGREAQLVPFNGVPGREPRDLHDIRTRPATPDPAPGPRHGRRAAKRPLIDHRRTRALGPSTRFRGA